MTKRDLNVIRHAAYIEWEKTADGQELLKTAYEHFNGWEISEGQNRGFLTTVFDTQINNETLKAMGFSPEANIKLLFEVDRKTKTLTPASCWWH